MSTKRVRSVVAITKLLKAEGMSPNLMNTIRKYALRQWHHSQVQKYFRAKRSLKEMCKKLTEGDKAILGRYIGMEKAMSFQTGLRIGLAGILSARDVVLHEDEIVGLNKCSQEAGQAPA